MNLLQRVPKKSPVASFRFRKPNLDSLLASHVLKLHSVHPNTAESRYASLGIKQEAEDRADLSLFMDSLLKIVKTHHDPFVVRNILQALEIYLKAENIMFSSIISYYRGKKLRVSIPVLESKTNDLYVGKEARDILNLIE